MSKITVKLIGEDGNIFNLMAIVRKAMLKNHMDNEWNDLQQKIFKSSSYNEALQLIMEYVDVE